MRIAIVCHPYFPLKEPYAGGLEMIVHLLIKSLEKEGHDITVYAHPDSQVPVTLVPIDVANNCMKEQYKLNIETDYRYLIDIAFAKAVHHISINNYDIVHNHTMDSIAYLALSSLKIPVLNTFHTPIFPCLIMAVEMMDQWSNMYAAAVSKSLAHTYMKKIAHVDVVYNGIDVEAWEFNNDTMQDYLFWSGRICKEKGTEDAIKLAIKCGKKLLIAGPRFSEDYFKDHVEPYLDNDLISYVGHLNHDQLKRYMSNAAVFLFTSHWEEPYGLVLAEALSSGTPVLGYNVGAASEIVDSTSGVLVPVGDIDALANSLNDAIKLKRISCRHRAETFCDYRSMTNNYIALYANIIENYKREICIA